MTKDPQDHITGAGGSRDRCSSTGSHERRECKALWKTPPQFVGDRFREGSQVIAGNYKIARFLIIITTTTTTRSTYWGCLSIKG